MIKTILFVVAQVTLGISIYGRAANETTVFKAEIDKALMPADSFTLKVHAIKILVPDMSKALSFYKDVLGFHVSMKDKKNAVIYTNQYTIILSETKEAKYFSPPGIGNVNIALQVHNLDSTYTYLKSKNVLFVSEEKRKEGVGYAYKIYDPFGNHISLLQHTVSPTENFKEPFIYNCGLFVPDLESETVFFTGNLGFVVITKKYLPYDMPIFYANQEFAFVLHLYRKEYPHVFNTNLRIVFKADYLNKIYNQLKENGVRVKKKNNTVLFWDAAGICSEIVE